MHPKAKLPDNGICSMRMSKYAFAVSLIAGILLTVSCSLPRQSNLNQSDVKGNRHGRWITWWDREKDIKMFDGYFQEGHETRTCRYYHPNGRKRVVFKYKNQNIRVRFWEPDGRKVQQGTSVMFITPDSISYYYHGKWKFYDESGRLSRVSLYENGKEIRILKERDSTGRMRRL